MSWLDEDARYSWTCDRCGSKESMRGAFMSTGPQHSCTQAK